MQNLDTLYGMITAKSELTGTDYESITNRELTLNTKGLLSQQGIAAETGVEITFGSCFRIGRIYNLNDMEKKNTKIG